jgi:endonuclease III
LGNKSFFGAPQLKRDPLGATFPRVNSTPSLRRVLTTLGRHYGKPQRPISRDPFKLILWEQVAYLVPDAQRRRAFAALRSQVGLTPRAIVAASDTKLRAITRLGGPIAVAVRATRLRQSAELAIGRWDGDLRTALRLSIPKARKALAEFAMIGEPGADKILVLAKRARLLPLDSNGLRVLCRLRLTTEEKDYRTTYRRAQAVLAPVLPKDSDGLIAAYYLLRLHGQKLCRRSEPQCNRCPLCKDCAFGSQTGRGAYQRLKLARR